MLQLRNPGIATIVMFALSAGLILFLIHNGATLGDASKSVLELLGLIVAAGAAFAGKSALVVDTSKRASTIPPPHPRAEKNPNLITWPEVPATLLPKAKDPMQQTWPATKRPPTIDVEVDLSELDEPTRPSIYSPASSRPKGSK